jgi:hypothetical protein
MKTRPYASTLFAYLSILASSHLFQITLCEV